VHAPPKTSPSASRQRSRIRSALAGVDLVVAAGIAV
jgi:hypothetical protein